MKKTLLSITVVTWLVVAFGSSKASHANPDASHQTGSSRKYQVRIDNFSFVPATLTVPVGSTVTWVNHDDMPHSVVSSEKILKSPVLDTDQEFSYTFAATGNYPYYCGIHPVMTGKVIVQ